jgi:hypothetical protein
VSGRRKSVLSSDVQVKKKERVKAQRSKKRVVRKQIGETER